MLEFLNRIRLTVVQWLGVAAVGAIAFLGLLLKRKNREIRKLEVDSIKKDFDHEVEDKKEALDEITKRREDAEKEYDNEPL